MVKDIKLVWCVCLCVCISVLFPFYLFLWFYVFLVNGLGSITLFVPLECLGLLTQDSLFMIILVQLLFSFWAKEFLVLNGKTIVSLEASKEPAQNDHHKQFSNLWGNCTFKIVTVWTDYMDMLTIMKKDK